MTVIRADCHNTHDFRIELRRTGDLDAVPLSSERVTDQLGDLVAETLCRGVLADVLDEDIDYLDIRIDPEFESSSPLVSRIHVHLSATSDGATTHYSQDFKRGAWSRGLQLQMTALIEEGTLDPSETVYQMLIATPTGIPCEIPLPPLQTPLIVDGTLDGFGVRSLGTGELVPDRPVLVNERRVVDETIEACLKAGEQETGSATLGALVRLPERLPGTSTRIVTLLTACVADRRHEGELNQWNISPQALAEGARIAELRGMGESIVTVAHTHGFNSACPGKCNSNAGCLLAQATEVSLKDYQVLETLFPSKSTLMPIAGRRLGTDTERPVMVIHGWRGATVRPIRWQRYID